MVAKYKITGPSKLSGEVTISGSKNTALPLLAATILTNDECILKNVPRVKDILTMLEVLQILGVNHKWIDSNSIKIQVNNEDNYEVSYDLMKTMRASICVLGPLLTKRKKAKVSIPGGCVIGVRPIDLHINSIKTLGASVEIKEGYIVCECDKLKGTTINLLGPHGSTVTGTENVILSAVLADGETVIENAAAEPEVTQLIKFLTKMGADISYNENEPSIIKVRGVKQLRGIEHYIPPDRIETGTFIVLALISDGKITINNINENHIENILQPLIVAGANIKIGNGYLYIEGKQRLKPLKIETAPYPGFPTDMNPIMCVLMTQIDGDSTLIDNVFPDRFIYTAELTRMGAKIHKEKNKITVSGTTPLSCANLMCSDIRSGAALALASSIANGQTILDRIYHIERGYENFDSKLKSLGVLIERIN